MSNSFIILALAAELEGIELKTLSKRIEHSHNSYKTERRPNPNGGKDLVYISVSSLSPQAQQRYKAKKKIAERKIIVPDVEP